MSRPLTGTREVFRRLEERQEARLIREHEQQELMGLQQEPSDTLENHMSYRNFHQHTMHSHFDGFRAGEVANLNPYSAGVGINLNRMRRRAAESINLIVRDEEMHTRSYAAVWNPSHYGSGIRGTRANYMYVDHEFDHMFQSSMYQSLLRHRSRITDEAPRFYENTRRIIATNLCAEIIAPPSYITYDSPTQILLAGGRHFDFFEGRWVNSPIKDKETGEIIFGPLKHYFKEKMNELLDTFMGVTKQQRKIMKLEKAKAGNKSFATLLLKRREK